MVSLFQFAGLNHAPDNCPYSSAATSSSFIGVPPRFAICTLTGSSSAPCPGAGVTIFVHQKMRLWSCEDRGLRACPRMVLAQNVAILGIHAQVVGRKETFYS